MIRDAAASRPAVAMATATGLSRVTGLLRTVALAATLGAYPTEQALEAAYFETASTGTASMNAASA